MAPFHSRPLLAWTLPTIAVLLSYLWYKKKRIGAQSDPGDKTQRLPPTEPEEIVYKTLKDELEDAEFQSTPSSSPNKSFSRSLSGVETTPIDIVIPRELRSCKTSPVVISDEDLDIEIEKVKSMKTGGSPTELNKSSTTSPPKSKSISPKTPNFDPASTPITSKAKNNKSEKKPRKSSSMAQKDTAVVEKLTSLKINPSKETPKKTSTEKLRKGRESKRNSDVDHELHRQSSERDSANHSPADVMLASPSLSSISDNHSEGSNDSGKGGSDVATPPPSRTPGVDGTLVDPNQSQTYEFILPQTLVGKLIGKQGTGVTQIREKSNANVIVRRHPSNNKLKICIVEGLERDIEKALKMIRERFPLRKFPEVTLEQVSFLPEMSSFPLIPDHLYLKLVEGVNNDTILSCMVAPNHLFLQQPTHPTFPSLNVLTNYMNACYSEVNSPLLPTPIPENTVCAAFSVDSWFRAMILSTDGESDTSYVKFLDWGGYAYVENAHLRQIRGDFMLLPFQAAECFLANVKPVGEDGQWSDEAYNLIAEITKGVIVYTQILDYTEDGIPLVNCYILGRPNQMVFLNEELVNSGHAEWLTFEENQLEGAVGGIEA